MEEELFKNLIESCNKAVEHVKGNSVQRTTVLSRQLAEMSSALQYKGFKARFEFSPDDNVYFGRLLNIDDIVSFHSETIEGLPKAFKEMVDFHIEVCEKKAQLRKQPDC